MTIVSDQASFRVARTGATLLSVVILVAAPASAVPRIDAVFVPASADRPNADLKPEFWATMPPVGGFLQREPHEGAEPSEGTEFRVAYDQTTLFVYVRAHDRDSGKIVSYLTRRDVDSPCDWIHVLVDSYHDRRTAYEFAVNPDGVKQDRYWYNDTSRDDSWDAVWDVRVSRDRSGWSAEFRIPFSQLRFASARSNTFGFAITRQIGRLNETSTWPLLARSANGYVSSFGELSLAMSGTPKRFELVPYTSVNLSTQPAGGNPLLKSTAPGTGFGVDLKYALTPGLTLTSTLNPDFGQVEADPAVVNLSAFETFFAERRPFFVEGSGTFRFDTDCNDGQCTGLFYSRRIGRSPQGIDNLPSGDGIYTDAPAQTTILGAAKVTGRVGGYSIGVMEAVTGEEFGRVLKGSTRSRQTIEPITSYSVGRLRREFANQSSIGFMLTAANRQLTSELNFLPEKAYTGGMDVDWRFLSRYSITGYYARSSVRGSAEAIGDLQENSRHYFQRPDLAAVHLDPTRRSLAGGAGMVAINKIGGRRVRFNSNVAFKSPGFDTNDIGFLRRADQRSMSNWLQIRSDRPTRWFRTRIVNLNQWAAWNYDGDRLFSGGNINAHAVFTNNWSTGAGYNVLGLGFDDRVSRGGPGVYTEGFNEAWYYLSTDNRRPVSLEYFGVEGSDGHGSSWRDVSPDVTFRPVPALMLSTGLRVSRSVVDSQWVTHETSVGDHYVFGHLDQTTVALTGRLNYTVSPNLSLQLYAQPFVSAGDYSAFKELVDARSREYATRYTPFAYSFAAADDPDFNVKSFRTTNVLRWEFKPGSTLFLVWQQARENDAVAGGFRFGRDTRGIFAVPPHNVFLVKLAYWLNY